MADSKQEKPASSKEVSQFLKKVGTTPVKTSGAVTSRLLFAMDATASREPSWDRACHLQGQMFTSTSHLGNLNIQLCYYRGFNQFHASRWCTSAESLLEAMSSVRCMGGYTQIKRVMEHAIKEHQTNRLRAVVFVGDAMEEDPDALCHLAGKMGVLGIPLFMFQEGQTTQVKNIFQQMAELTGGAYAPFDLKSASELKDLLSAVALFATGGIQALESVSKGSESNRYNLLWQQLSDPSSNQSHD